MSSRQSSKSNEGIRGNYRTKGRYYQYLAEFATGDTKSKAAEDARVAYAEELLAIQDRIKLLNVPVMMQKEGADHRDSPENCWSSTDSIFLIEWMTCLSWSGGKCPYMWMRHLSRWSESFLGTAFSKAIERRSSRFPPFPLSRMLPICP